MEQTLADILKARLEAKGMTRYAVAKRLAAADGNGKPVTAFTNRVQKIVNDPKGRIFSNLEEIVQLLGGEIVIRWTDTTDQVVH